MTATAMNNILELSQSYIISKLVMLAAEWKLDELLADGAKSVAQLSQALHCHPAAMRRYLRLLAAYNVVVLSKDQYVQATELTPYLNRLLSPHILDSYRVFEEVAYSLKTNEPAWSQTFKKAFYPFLVENPKKFEMFELWCSRTSEDWLPVVLPLY